MIDCGVTMGLLGRWYDHDLPADEVEAFEEHIVLCPPCLVESQRLRVALAALRGAGGMSDVELPAVETNRVARQAAGGASSYWKFLRSDGHSAFAAFDWRARAGTWLEASEPTQCRSGFHACRVEDLPYWMDDELWTIELEDVVTVGHKVAGSRARLGDQIEEWTRETAWDLSLSCLGRTVEHAVEELRTALLNHEALQLHEASVRLDSEGMRANLKAVAGECAGAAHRLLRRQAGRLSMYVVDAVDYIECPVATLAYIAARAANERSDFDADADPYIEERRWQAMWLVNRLRLEQR